MEDGLVAWDNEIAQAEKQKEEYEQDLAALREPFLHVLRTGVSKREKREDGGPSLMAFEFDRGETKFKEMLKHL